MMNIRFVLLMLLMASLSACTDTKHSLYRNLSSQDPHNTKYQGHYKVGSQYTVKHKTYKPSETKHYNEIGMASWYGKRYGFHGKKTANGDKYNKSLLTAAHPSLPMPSLVKVTNLGNKKSLIVMVNDRGPFAKNRIIDLSEQAATILKFRNQGVAKVQVEYLHEETENFLANLGLKRKPHYVAPGKLKNPKCSVNCHVKLVNLKHKLL